MTFWVAGAVVVGAGANMLAANSASNAQRDAANQANDTQWNMYQQTRTDNLPALGARNDALAKLEFMLGVGSGQGQAGYGSLP